MMGPGPSPSREVDRLLDEFDLKVTENRGFGPERIFYYPRTMNIITRGKNDDTNDKPFDLHNIITSM